MVEQHYWTSSALISFSIKLDITKTPFVFPHRTEVSVFDLCIYPNAQVIPPLSAILSPEDTEIAFPALKIRVENNYGDVDFVSFFKVNLHFIQLLSVRHSGFKRKDIHYETLEYQLSRVSVRLSVPKLSALGI